MTLAERIAGDGGEKKSEMRGAAGAEEAAEKRQSFPGALEKPQGLKPKSFVSSNRRD
jgi:hypothetical protein